MIKIGNRFALGADSENIIIYIKHISERGKNEGKEMWVASAYFATVSGALDYLIEQSVKETKLEDFKTVCLEIDKLKVSIKALGLSRETL